MKNFKVGDHVSGKYLERHKFTGTIISVRTDWNMNEIYGVQLDKPIRHVTYIELYKDEIKL